jgi:hypothetical protein
VAGAPPSVEHEGPHVAAPRRDHVVARRDEVLGDRSRRRTLTGLWPR